MQPKDIVRRMAKDWRFACSMYQIENRQGISGVRAPTVPLRWNKPQQKLAAVIAKQEAAKKPVRLLLLKRRKLGGSTLIQSYAYWRASKERNLNALTLSHDEEGAENLHNISRGIYRRMPPQLRPMIERESTTELVFGNPSKQTRDIMPGLESRMVCSTAGSMARDGRVEGTVGFYRGATGFQIVHASEVSSWPSPRKLLASLMSAVPDDPGTAVFLESTANMRGDYWHELCRDAMSGNSEFEFVFVPWFELDGPDSTLDVDPETVENLDAHEEWLLAEKGVTLQQIAWKRWKLQSIQFRGDHDAFLREYPEDPESCFSSTGNSVFGKWMRVAETTVAEPVLRGDLITAHGEVQVTELPGADLWVFEAPKPDKSYVVGADVAYGLDRDDDDSAAVVMRDTGAVVACFAGKMSPGEFADFLMLLGTWYNSALIGCERNGPGIGVLEQLVAEYGNLYQEEVASRYGVKTARAGWVTTKQSKARLVKGIQTRLFEETDAVALMDRRLASQLGTFVKTPDGKLQASSGCRDDLVIAYGIGVQCLSEVSCGFQVLQLDRKSNVRLRALTDDDAPRFRVLGR